MSCPDAGGVSNAHFLLICVHCQKSIMLQKYCENQFEVKRHVADTFRLLRVE